MRHGQRIALMGKTGFRREPWSYAHLLQTADCFASYLHTRGVKKGDRVALCAPNQPNWVAAFFGCLSCGAIVVPLDVQSSPDLTAQVIRDGWFYTGDLVRVDEDGYLEYVEKKSFIIVTPSGLKISPWDVEDVLLSHPAVAEAAYVGVGCVPDELIPTAFIVLKDGQVVTEEELAALCRQNLADFKLPKKFEFVDSIPRTGSGKIKRQQLKESQG